jgi:hypothetical protein
MASMINRLFYGFKSHSKPRLKLMQVKAPELFEQGCYIQQSPFRGVSNEYLNHIVMQVKADGYHVESLNIFRYGNLKPTDSIFAIEHWAASVGLRLCINHEYDICFFEKL